MFRRRLGLGLLVGMLIALSAAAPASAADVIDSDGMWGTYTVDDSGADPGAKCGYGPENASGYAFFKWMKAYAPQVYARDTTGGRDHQKVRWIFKLQRSVQGGAFKTVVSAEQTATAYDDTPAGFTPLKLYKNGRDGDVMRAILLIKWMRNGSVEGWVKLRIGYYSVKWTVGSPDYVFDDACTGRAD